MCHTDEKGAAPPPCPAATGPWTGVVKWYDAGRGFGFLVPDGRDEDAFLHASVLRRAGETAVEQGDRMTCLLARRARGLVVASVIRVERGAAEREGRGVRLLGRVEWYDAARGYGFVRAESGEEVFVGAKILRRLGLTPLRIGQTVRVSVAPGPRGLAAETLTFPA